MSDYTDRTIQKLQEYEAELHSAIREAVVAVKGSQEFRDAVEDLLKDTPYRKPICYDHEGLYGRVRNAIREGPLMKIDVKDGQVTSIKLVKDIELAVAVEEFVGWWDLNRDGSVNRTFDYIDKATNATACGAGGSEMIEQCDIVAPPTEYWQNATQCERPKGHDGPHVAIVSDSSRRIWQDVQFKMNFIEAKA